MKLSKSCLQNLILYDSANRISVHRVIHFRLQILVHYQNVNPFQKKVTKHFYFCTVVPLSNQNFCPSTKRGERGVYCLMDSFCFIPFFTLKTCYIRRKDCMVFVTSVIFQHLYILDVHSELRFYFAEIFLIQRYQL